MSMTDKKKLLKKRDTTYKIKEKSQTDINYNEYQYDLLSWIHVVLQGIGIVLGIAYLFYYNQIAFLILLPFAFYFPILEKEKKKKKRQDELNREFKEAILSISSSLSVGYSIENACKEAYQEMLTVFGENSLIGKELYRIVCGIDLNIPIEELLDNLGKRSGLEDIRNFTEVFKVAKRTGGDLPAIIRQTVETIDEKLKVREEIVTMTTSVRYEGLVMSVIPPGIILYLRISSPDFFNPLYTTLFGRIFMTGCLIVYLGTLKLQQKMLEVDI